MTPAKHIAQLMGEVQGEVDAEAADMRMGTTVLNTLESILGAALTHYAVCPECAATGTVRLLVQHLNDEHRWAREAIADWLDGVL